MHGHSKTIHRSLILVVASIYPLSAVVAEIRPDGVPDDGVVSVVYRQGDGNISIQGDGNVLTSIELVSTANDFLPPQAETCGSVLCFGTQTKLFGFHADGFEHLDLGPRAIAGLAPADLARRWTVTGTLPAERIDSAESGGSMLDLIVFETDLIGDFSSNRMLDARDMDILTRQARYSRANPNFDLNGDSAVSSLDRDFWLHDLVGTWYGDANLDGVFDSTDFLNVFAAGEYNDQVRNNSTWSTGDWNGDGEFGTADLIVAFQDRGYEMGKRPPKVRSILVPEPNCLPLVIAFFGVGTHCRRRFNRAENEDLSIARL